MAPARLPAAPVDPTSWDDALLSELLSDTTDATDALLAELLADEPTPALRSAVQIQLQVTDEATPTTSTRATKSRTQLQKRGAGPNKGVDKRTLALKRLREEVSQLTSELKRLREETSSAIEPLARTAKEITIDERIKRRRAEDQCRQLREAMYAQTQFLRGLRSIVSTPLPLSPVDLTQYFHNYTRLPRDRSTRWSEYAALAQEARFQAAMDMLCRETQKMATSDEPAEIVPTLHAPFLWSELRKHRDGFSMTSMNVYALETDDLGAALRGLCVAVREIPARDPVYQCVSRKKQLVDSDAALPSTASGSNIIYRVMGVDHLNDDDEVTVESHNITLYRQANDHALLLEDFIDDDELHPQDVTADVTRQVVGAYLLRRELCSDGLGRTVIRTLRTRRYRFHARTPPAVLQRFQELISETMKDNELIFRQLILETIDHEQRAFAQALSQLRASESASYP